VVYCFGPPCIAEIPLGSSRLDSTRLDTFDVSSESRRACRLCRAVLFQHGGRRTSYNSARLYNLVVFMLLHTQIILVPSNKINQINVYSNKLVNNLHIITLYILHSKLSCVSSESRRTCRAWRLTSVSSRVCSNMADDEETVGHSACVYKFSFLCFVRTRKEKKTTRSVS